jgi:hypothetical protein
MLLPAVPSPVGRGAVAMLDLRYPATGLDWLGKYVLQDERARL